MRKLVACSLAHLLDSTAQGTVELLSAFQAAGYQRC
jgi:hypothetical protein